MNPQISPTPEPSPFAPHLNPSAHLNPTGLRAPFTGAPPSEGPETPFATGHVTPEDAARHLLAQGQQVAYVRSASGELVGIYSRNPDGTLHAHPLPVRHRALRA